MASHKETVWTEVKDKYMIDDTAIMVTPRFLAYLIYFVRYEVLLPLAAKSAKKKPPTVPKVDAEVAKLLTSINAAIASCTMEEYMVKGNKVLPFKAA